LSGSCRGLSPPAGSPQPEECATNSQKLIRELLGLIFILCGLLILLSLWTFDIKDPTLNQSVSGSARIRNAAGLFGAYLSGFLTDIFGLGSYLWAAFFLALGAGFVSSWFVIVWYRWVGYLLLAACLLFAAEGLGLAVNQVEGGGVLGAWLYVSAHRLFSPAGSTLVWFFALLAGMELSFRISWLALTGKGVCATARQVKKLPRPSLSNIPLPKLSLSKARLALPAGRKKEGESLVLDIDTGPKSSESPAVSSVPERTEGRAKKGETEKNEKAGLLGRLLEKNEPAPDNTEAQDEVKTLPLPSPALLTPPSAGDSPRPDRETLEAKGEALMTCLRNFGVQATLANIVPGPVITVFEVRPDPGVKASRIASLAADLAMSLKAVAVRIQAPIPGTDTVGVEIPNDEREGVNFREVVEADSFQKSSSLLTVALGKDTGGRPVAADLARMPHLLVAGATGAGKSVCLNGLILSLLYKARPDQVQMLLVDPKRVELAMYADLPHLVHPVVTEMDLAQNALLWAIEEMDRRYERFKQTGVRNITGYNEKMAKLAAARTQEGSPDETDEDLSPMSFLVIIVDELADLMMKKGKDVESSIVRLAQLARAAGIHLIIATQRPSVDVVTGLIKANFPCRIAFQVTSNHDSRTILDGIGAEALLGKGDMLFKPGGGKLQRLHGAFVSDDEVAAVVEHWKKLQKPAYSVDFSDMGSETDEEAPSHTDGPERNDVVDDPIYAEAVQFVREQGRVSISLLQRRFRVGFNRAARYVEQMERDGIVTPGDSTKPRNVIG